MSRIGLLRAALVLWPLLVLSTRVAGAQAASAFDAAVRGTTPEWTTNWSPVAPIGELPRVLPGSDIQRPALLTLPPRRVGAFWTAGNPGSLAFDVTDRRTAFEFGLSDIAGRYRRPLDPGTASHQVLSALGWGALGPRAAGIARVVVDRGTFDDGAFGDVLVPYTSDPYTIADTLGERVGRTGVLIEGAGGWRVGPFGLGLSLGFHQQNTRTVESAVPVLLRSATPGVTGGLTWTPLGRRLHVGFYGRWRQTVEFVAVVSLAAGTRLYRFSGYAEPVPINLVGNLHTQRFERNSTALGGTLSGELGSVVWVLYAQRERLGSDNFTTTVASATRDKWSADGWSGGGAAQTSLAAGRLRLTASGRFRTLTGESTEADIEGVPFMADEKRWELNGDVRWVAGGGWVAGATLGLVRELRLREDGLAETASDVRTWSPWSAAEVSRRVGRWSIAVGGSVAERNASGSVPDPSVLGPIYRNWIASAVAFEAGAARAVSGTMTIRWQARPTTGLWLQGRAGNVSPAGGVAQLPLAPAGNRRWWQVRFGVVLDP